MASLPFSALGLNLRGLSEISVAQVFFSFIVLLFSLTVHEMAHAAVADRLGDPTARLLGRVSLNPMVHADLVGTVVFPLLASVSGLPLIGWAKPVPVAVGRLGRPRRDFVLVALAGPVSNLALALAGAIVIRALPAAPGRFGPMGVYAPLATLAGRAIQVNVLLALFNLIPIPPLDGGNVLGGLLPRPLAGVFDRVRPYGFLLIYGLVLSGGLRYVMTAPYYLLLSWLL
jgi:Zn-dependent protease